MEEAEFEALSQNQAPILQSMLSIVHTMALKCAVELRLAEIIHSHNGPITLSQIASSIDSPSPPDISFVKRIMRLLVRDKIFTAHQPSDGGETLYGPTKASTWILNDFQFSLSPLVSLLTQSFMTTPLTCLSQCVKEGGTGFEKVHHCKIYEYASQNPEFNHLFNIGMASTTRIIRMAIATKYKDGFNGIGTLVDVGGGIGETIAAIVEQHPHIKGINFDLPHVISSSPEYNGVTHIEGNMFEAIPKADAIFLKWILHNWNDEDCVTILKNCKKAIPDKIGKVIIAEVVLNPDGSSPFNEASICMDLRMLAVTGGKERTEPEWKKILEGGGFPRYKIINITPILCFIEGYLE